MMSIKNYDNKFVSGLQSGLLTLGLLFTGWSQAAQVCDESLAATTPDEEFNINTDGTVSHLKTELMWDRCSWGLSGENCESGTTGTYTWDEALQQAEIANSQAYKGYTDWRLPSKRELTSLVEYQCYGSAINETVFPAVSSSGFWSSSPNAKFSNYAWYVYFSNGSVSSNDEYDTLRVRLVRGGQAFAFLPDAPEQSCNGGATTLNNGEYTIDENGTANHHLTKLMWDRCAWGLSGANCETGTAQDYTWTAALAQVEQVNSQNYKGYSDWRLPTAYELHSISEEACYDPALNTSVFPSTPASGFWSSSPNAGNSYGAWGVFFYNGDVNSGNENYTLRVRLVRGGQAFDFLPEANQSPSAQFTLSPASGQAPLSVTLNGSASSDPEADNLTYAWTINGAAVGNGAMQFDYTFNTAGDYLIALTVTDSEGLSHSSSQNLTVTAQPVNQAPTAAFSLSHTSGQASLTVTLDGTTSSDPEADNLTYAWTINGDAVGNATMQFEHRFNSAGDYLVRLTVTDSEGLSHSSSQTLTVTAQPVNQAPSAAFTLSPASGQAPLTVTLDGTASSDPEADNLTYAWTINGDAVGNGAMQFEHRFNSADDYLVRLTVTDSEGLSHTSSQNLSVDAQVEDTPPVAGEKDVLEFSTEKNTYDIGEHLKVDLLEKISTNRFQRVDLWIAIEVPNGFFFFMTALPLKNTFDILPQAYKKSIETSDITHRVLEFEVPPGMGGIYRFYALTVAEGKNPVTDGSDVYRSDLAILEITLANQ
ncbi:Lcl C-terminal domain-containing protein [Candidatus Venteria ishoeyi]|uniref:Microbial collagenase n=1 Tax=Candidatus Venteria ishoeyi TaxID=1899563 RepID=A0A1H6FIM8_9GAMM|nr:DUF1566 domain-containing protein [Candidatus Venteria ishoeyi]SEH08905.1 Microbial collagenase precursor [Candidatus Venteria ishoeyi]